MKVPIGKEKKIIGITGSLASGKTKVADIFVSLGAVKIDADAIAHKLLRVDEDIKQEIVRVFGPSVAENGAISRKALALVVFSDRKKLEDLCRITHPAIIREIRSAVSRAEADVVVVDAPLLFESGLDREVDIVVTVSASERTCLKRAVARGIPEDMARRIMESQMSSDRKISMADHVIDNENNVENTKEGVKRVWQKM